MSTTSLSSLLKNIEAKAVQAAAPAAAEAAAAELGLSFRDFSGRTAASEGFVLPVAPATIKPYGFQTAAVETVLQFRRAIIGFAPGMGKTVTAQLITAAFHATEGLRTVVIVPPTLRIDPWQRGFAKEFPGLRVAVVEGKKEAPVPADTDVVVIGESVINDRLDDIKAWDPRVIIVDEAQHMKNPGALRSKATQELVDAAYTAGRFDGVEPVVVLLTGTLAVGRPDEIYMPTRIAGSKVAKAVSGAASFSAFQKRWCYTEQVHIGNGKYVTKTVGCVDSEGLHERLRSICYIRVEREEVLDMPEKVWGVFSLELNGSLRTYRRMEKEFIAWVAENYGDKAAMRAARAEAVTMLMALWKEAGTAKAQAAAEYIEDLVMSKTDPETGKGIEPVVAMAWHKDTIAIVKKALTDRGISVVTVTGDDSPKRKVAAQDAFRAGEAQVLLGNIKAAGEGLNLEVSCELVFVQLPWTPGLMVQASDRIYRMTQQRACNIHVLNAIDTVDERLFGTIDRKAKVVDVINSGRTDVTMPAIESIENSVLSAYGFDLD